MEIGACSIPQGVHQTYLEPRHIGDVPSLPWEVLVLTPLI